MRWVVTWSTNAAQLPKMHLVQQGISDCRLRVWTFIFEVSSAYSTFLWVTMVSVGEISLMQAARGEGEVVWEGDGLVIFIVRSRHSE